MGQVAKKIVCLWVAMLVPVAFAAPDVRVILDVSESMAAADPQNHRAAALQVLIRMLPAGAYGGIWTYAGDARSLVKHGPTTGLWRETALIKIRDVPGRRGASNLPEAFAAATWDIAEPSARERHVVVVSASASPALRGDMFERIPALKSAGFTVHTLGVGAAIDSVVLEQLALGTDGYLAEVVDPAHWVPSTVKLLDHAIPPARLPARVAGTFRVDAGIDEITVLRLRQDNAADLVLQSPLGRRFSRTTPRTEVKWHEGERYDLLSLRNPAPGDWRFRSGASGEVRVVAVGDLSLELGGLAGVMFPGGPKTFSLGLSSRGKPVADPAFLELLTVKAALDTPSASQTLVVEAGKGGKYDLHLLALAQSGDHALRVQLRGPTFERELVVPFVVRNPVTLDIRPAPEGAALWVDVSAPGVDPASLQVAAQVKRPPGPAKVVPAQAFPAGLWKMLIPGTQKVHEVTLMLSGKYLNGNDFRLKSEPLRLEFPVVQPTTISLDAGGKQIRAALRAAAAPRTPPSSATASAPAAAQALDTATAEPEAQLPVWFTGVVVGLGLLLVGAFWWLLKPRQEPHTLPDDVVVLRSLLREPEAQVA